MHWAKKNRLSSLPGFLLSGLVLSSIALPVYSVDYTWVLSGGGEWVDGNSWDNPPDYPQNIGDSAFVENLAVPFTITTTAPSVSYTALSLDGNTANGTISPGLASTGLHIVDQSLNFNGTNAIVYNFTVPIQLGPDAAAGVGVFAFSSVGTVQFYGPISETSPNTPLIFAFLTSGPATVPNFILTAPTTYTGGTEVGELGGSPVNLFLTGTATLYSAGTVTINSGTLDISTLSTSPTIGDLVGTSGTINLGSNTLVINSNTPTTSYAGTFAGTDGSFFKNGSGALNISGTVTNTGNILVNNGSLIVTGPVALDSAAQVGVGGATLDLSSYSGTVLTVANLFGTDSNGAILTGAATISIPLTSSQTYSGTIQGFANVNISGSTINTLTLPGVSTYIGGTTLTGATTIISAETGLGNGSAPLSFVAGNLTLTPGSVASFSGTVTFSTVSPNIPTLNVMPSATLTFSGTVLQSGGDPNAFIKSGDGTLILTNPSNGGVGGISGSITVLSGGLIASSDSALGTSSATLGFGPISSSQPSLTAAGTITSTRPVVLNSSTTLNTNGYTISFAGPMSGAGGFIKNGSGTLALSGNNSFTGAGTVTQGVLNLNGVNSAGATAGILLGTVTTPATLQAGSSFALTATVSMGSAGAIFDSNGFSLSMINGISGTGSVTIIGSGTIAITNSPLVYNGATFVQAGTYQIIGTSTLPASFPMNIAASGILDISGASVSQTVGNLSGSGTISLGAQSLSANITQASIFSGSILDGGSGGTFTKLGAAQLSLRGPINIVGNFINQQGVVALEDNGIVNGSTFVNSGTINFRTATTKNFSGLIMGTGSVGILGSGTVNWIGTGPNTYSGDTKVESGVLQLGMSATAIPNVLEIAGGQVNLVLANQTALATSVVKLNSGTFNLGSNNTSIKRLEANGGSLQGTGVLGLNDLHLGNSSLPSAILNFIGSTPSITFSGTNSAIASTIFTSHTAIHMSNQGTLTLSQSSGTGFTVHSGTLVVDTGTYTGDCKVLGGGKLNVAGNLQANSLTINQGGTLLGVGTVSAPLTLQGTLAPGNSIGTINLIGNQTFTSTSTLQNEFDVNSASSDLVNITGSLTIQPGATLQLVATPTTIIIGNKTYTIVQSTGTIAGTFTLDTSQITSSSSFTVTYNPHSILLTTMPFASNIGGNPGTIANILNGLSPPVGSDLYNVIASIQLLPTEQDRIDALNELQPSMLKGISISAQNNLIRTRLASDLRIKEIITHACNPEKEQFTAWADLQVDYLDQGNKGLEPGFHTTSFGPIFGFDFVLASNAFFGASGNYTHSNIMFQEGRGKGSLDAGYVSSYAGIYGDHFYVDAIVEGGLARCNESRYLKFADRIAKGHSNLGSFLGHVEGGLIYENDRLEFRPFLSTEYLYMHWQAFHEGGADSVDLEVDSSNYTMLRSEAGLYFNRCFKLRSRAKIRFGGKLSYIREDRFQGESFKAHFASIPEEFTVNGLNPDRNLFSPAATFVYIAKTGQGRFIIDYEAEIGKQFADQNIRFEYAFRF